MASGIDTVQYIVDQAGLGRRLEFRRMFRGYALYVDSKVVAFVCDDQLFLKPSLEGLRFLGEVKEAPPYPGARNYYLLTSELDDPDRLNMALRVTADALPAPKPKGSKSRPVPANKSRAKRSRL